MESEDLVQVFGPHLLSTHYTLGIVGESQCYEVCCVIILILQMRELWYKEVKKLAQGHTTSKLQGLGNIRPEFTLLPICHIPCVILGKLLSFPWSWFSHVLKRVVIMPSLLGSYTTMDDRNLVFSKYWLISEKRIILKWLKNTN